MTNDAGGIPDFLQRNPQPPAETAKPERQPRQRRQTKATAAEPAPESAKPKKPRKTKEPKERAAPDTIKVSLKEYAETRVTAFQREFIKLYKIIAPLPAKMRGQILAELQKVLG